LRELLLLLPFNDFDAVETCFQRHGTEIAAVILEPISLNTGCVSPSAGFLETLRRHCDAAGALLIFDEVLTGFRVAYGGATELFGVRPDLVCLGKALGCGMPVAALAGRAECMNVLSPVGPVEMAGTNTGRLMTVLGTLAALQQLRREGFYRRLRTLNDRMVAGCRQLFARYGVPAYVEGYGGRIGIHIGSEQRPVNYSDVVAMWNEAYHLACFRKFLAQKALFGFLLPLSTCPEPVTLSAAHTEAEIDETLSRLEDVLKTTPYHGE
ncbi:aminotransferase class III-fold pyridoxal phosphate-dependent enzyme, partial [bacterium]|nr:aminotransferase class III-fold pyridoxal phosphate-dependent enzyme [candidate division CSSED10-310 bacterium]